MVICVAEFDDYPIHAERMIKQMDFFRKVNPSFKATLFAIPSMMKDEHFSPILDRPWLRLGVHGIRHRKGECRKMGNNYIRRGIEMAQDRPYDMICKPPHYGYGSRYVNIMHKAGYGFSCRTQNDILRWFDSALTCPTVQSYCKYEQPFMRMFGHPSNVPFMFNNKTKKDNMNVLESTDKFLFSTEAMENKAKIYLGSGEHKIDGFEHFDKQSLSGTKQWEWGQTIPYRDNSVSFVLIQQSLMYAPLDMYPQILKEIHRVMCFGGVLLIKEDNAENYIWKPIGKAGVLSHSTPRITDFMLYEAGFAIKSVDSLKLMEKYPALINRKEKVKRGKMYIIEATKEGGRL